MWRNLKPLLDDIPSQLYFRICAQNCLDRKLVSSLFNMELPFFTKYLLTAAYIASYNPVSSDKRFFLKIATLCRLRLVNQVSSTTVLSVAKYRCMAPFEVVRQVASTVKIDLVQYLYDYVLK
ncbi:unnamed protein product [Soboliphyme baturini]|uniref:B-like cyclin n=1 Tax=Soboliphyme baturini TaxID=241478 RepID=A0A183IVZ2_9BILA|nr:unnamed protein product [Soboliphyme baturini]